MSRHEDEWKRELADNLKRAGQELALGLAAEAAEQLTRARARRERKHEARRQAEEARLARQEAKRRRREARRTRGRPAESAVAALAAFVFLVLTFTTDMWWMVFVALGMGVHAAQLFDRRASLATGAESSPAPTGEREATPADARAARIDEVCGRLRHALAEAPESVRAFLSHQPEQTVESLRVTCQDLLRRELALRALASPEEQARLEGEREALRARITSARDEVVRARLEQALAALEHQLAQHSQGLQSAERLEAERVRLGYTLEGLYAQVMRLRTMDAGSVDVAGAGLRVSLDQLREELAALADAAEDVNRLEWAVRGGAPARVAPLEPTSEPRTPVSPRGRGRA